MPLNREKIGGPLRRFLPHNVREGLHALYALARFRNSAKARDTAERCIATISRNWNPGEGWNRAYLEQDLGLVLVESATNHPFVPGLARALGPLVKYYKATEHRPALDLAVVLKEKLLADHFLADGAYDAGRLGTHTHSVTCVLSSLAELYEVTRETRLLERVHAFFQNGLKELSDEIGWAIEGTTNPGDPDRGEANCTGDIVETCLILGTNGYPACLGRAERILRSHLLPSQLRDVSFIVEPANPTHADGKRAVADRHLGAFGFPAPYGHRTVEGQTISFNLDIVGGAVGSLCEAYRQVAVSDGAGHRVHLLFDHETPALKVESPYAGGSSTVTMKEPGPVSVRIPAWVDRAALRADHRGDTGQWREDYLRFEQPVIGEKIALTFPLAEQELVLRHRTRAIRTRLRGDEVRAMDNFGAPLAYFAAYA